VRGGCRKDGFVLEFVKAGLVVVGQDGGDVGVEKRENGGRWVGAQYGALGRGEGNRPREGGESQGNVVEHGMERGGEERERAWGMRMGKKSERGRRRGGLVKMGSTRRGGFTGTLKYIRERTHYAGCSRHNGGGRNFARRTRAKQQVAGDGKEITRN